jgi:hypothetical protein
LGKWHAAWPLAARAQQSDQMRRIGVVILKGEKPADLPVQNPTRTS